MSPDFVQNDNDMLGLHENTWKPSKLIKRTRREKRQNAWPEWRMNVLPRVSVPFLITEQKLFLREELPPLPTANESNSKRCPNPGRERDLRAVMVQCVEPTGMSKCSYF